MADSPSTTRSDSPLPGNAVILSQLFRTCHTVKVSPVSCAVWCGFPVNLPVLYHTVKVSTGSCAVWYRNPVIIMLFSCFAAFFCRVVRKLIFLFFVFAFCWFSLMTSRVTYDANCLINRCLFVARSRLHNFRFVCGK